MVPAIIAVLIPKPFQSVYFEEKEYYCYRFWADFYKIEQRNNYRNVKVNDSSCFSDIIFFQKQSQGQIIKESEKRFA